LLLGRARTQALKFHVSQADPATAEPEGEANRPVARAATLQRYAIRRVHKPRMTGLLDSPVRNLAVGVAFTLTVMALATAAYMSQGWSFRDASTW
jgi:hypothetical protein